MILKGFACKEEQCGEVGEHPCLVEIWKRLLSDEDFLEIVWDLHIQTIGSVSYEEEEEGEDSEEA